MNRILWISHMDLCGYEWTYTTYIYIFYLEDETFFFHMRLLTVDKPFWFIVFHKGQGMTIGR